MKKILFTLALLFPFYLYAQDCTYGSEGKTYPSLCFRYLNGDGIGISIVKNGNAGFLILDIKDEHENFFNKKIKGDVYLFLTMNKTIKLINRNYYWKVNGHIYTRFILMSNEINILKQYNISSIRYYYCDVMIPCNEATEEYNDYFYYTVKDENINYESQNYGKIIFPTLISDLFDN